MKTLPDIAQAWEAHMKKTIQAFPMNNLRASSIGNPCNRYHYHSVINWRDKSLPDTILQSIFNEGSLHEKAVVTLLSDLGYNVIEQQRSFQIDRPLITGHIDGKINVDGDGHPFDVKSINDYYFNKLSSTEDFLNSKKVYHRNYVSQLQLYLLMSGHEYGCLILKNKTTGQIKDVWMKLNFDFCESILKKAEAVYSAIEKKTPPDRTDDFALCNKCDFKHVCLPDMAFGTSTFVLEDEELLVKLNRREELELFKKEYDEIDEELSELRDRIGAGEFVCGNYIVIVKEIEKKSKVADTWHTETKKYLTKKIVRVKDE